MIISNKNIQAVLFIFILFVIMSNFLFYILNIANIFTLIFVLLFSFAWDGEVSVIFHLIWLLVTVFLFINYAICLIKILSFDKSLLKYLSIGLFLQLVSSLWFVSYFFKFLTMNQLSLVGLILLPYILIVIYLFFNRKRLFNNYSA